MPSHLLSIRMVPGEQTLWGGKEWGLYRHRSVTLTQSCILLCHLQPGDNNPDLF